MNEGLNQIRVVLWNLLLLTAGSILVAIATNGILLPLGFVTGGFLGMCMVVYYVCPVLPLSLFYVFFNLPLYAMGWRMVGRRFFIYSILGAIILTLAIEYIHISLPIADRMLAAIIAGIFSGAGGGIILNSLGSSGGVDILSVILLKRYSLRVSFTILGFNIAVLLALAFISSLEAVCFALIHFYVTAKITDLVVTTSSQRKSVLIISTNWEKILDNIVKKNYRGATILYGIGGCSGQPERIIYTVVARNEISHIKDLILNNDPEALVVISETSEVMGKQIGNQPHW